MHRELNPPSGSLFIRRIRQPSASINVLGFLFINTSTLIPPQKSRTKRWCDRCIVWDRDSSQRGGFVLVGDDDSLRCPTGSAGWKCGAGADPARLVGCRRGREPKSL